MYYFLGIDRIDFVNRDTSEAIQGYNVHLAETAQHGISFCAFKNFLRDEQFKEIFGNDLNTWKDYCLKQCFPSFGRRGRLEGIRFDKK